MSIAETLLPEIDQEMATTRRLLERVPSDKADWKPHPKSFSLGHLAQLIARMPGWMTHMVASTEIDLGKFPGYSNESTDSLVAQFDRNVAEARAKLAAAKDADFDVPWSLKHTGQVLMTQPRGTVIRSHINHMIHHRGQLTVYLRLVDVPLPSVYGPTADEKW
jgi:uncharacterized damage-inducible protein DinB